MYCPKCNSENNDSAKFCKKCGTPLKNTIVTHGKMMDDIHKQKSDDNTTKIIIVALIVVAVVLAGAFAYIYGFGNDNQQEDVNQDNSDEDAVSQTTQTSSSAQQTQTMTIKGGSFSTDGGLEDLTYASIYVGSEHAGEKVTIQIFYSRDGNSLNDGNMVKKTVDSTGYINVHSADAYKYFPDYAEIYLYDSSGNTLLDTQSVSLSPTSGTQSF